MARKPLLSVSMTNVRDCGALGDKLLKIFCWDVSCDDEDAELLSESPY